MICHRYEYVSYSQLALTVSFANGRCLWYVIDTNMSAIHNKTDTILRASGVVYDMS